MLGKRRAILPCVNPGAIGRERALRPNFNREEREMPLASTASPTNLLTSARRLSSNRSYPPPLFPILLLSFTCTTCTPLSLPDAFGLGLCALCFSASLLKSSTVPCYSLVGSPSFKSRLKSQQGWVAVLSMDATRMCVPGCGEYSVRGRGKDVGSKRVV